VSFEIRPREFVCISGDNQDETSALLKLIYGELQPTGGDVLIDNFRISCWNMGSPTGVVAYVPHKGELFDGTVMDNITMFEPGKELDPGLGCNQTGEQVIHYSHHYE
jgi:ATP-binding cassette subfamily C protein LapB